MEYTPLQVERISARVHDAWWEEKKEQGFHAPLECSHGGVRKHGDKFDRNCEKCHPDMYPYDELPEQIKDYDRVTVKTVLDAIP